MLIKSRINEIELIFIWNFQYLVCRTIHGGRGMGMYTRGLVCILSNIPLLKKITILWCHILCQLFYDAKVILLTVAPIMFPIMHFVGTVLVATNVKGCNMWHLSLVPCSMNKLPQVITWLTHASLSASIVEVREAERTETCDKSQVI